MAELLSTSQSACNRPLTSSERHRRHRAKKAAENNRPYTPRTARTRQLSIDLSSTDKRVRLSSGIAVDARRNNTMGQYYEAALDHFASVSIGESYGHPCDVCDRLWFKKDLRQVKDSHIGILIPGYGTACCCFQVCASCRSALDRGLLPTMSTINGFRYPAKPMHLPPLDPISTRLISPRLPFMAIRRIRRDGAYQIFGQVINVPIDVEETVKSLPRQLNDDFAFNVSIKKRLIHKSSYLEGLVKKKTIKQWLEFLVTTDLYRYHGISVDWPSLDRYNDAEVEASCQVVDTMDPAACDTEYLLGRQHTLLWSEDKVFEIAPGQNHVPLNITYDTFAEELSFPQIYYGTPRKIAIGVRATPFTLATSEIRRTDRRGVTPEHILYMAAKIMRYRVVDGIQKSFRCVLETENVTRRMLEDKDWMDRSLEKNFAYLKTLPNSAQYWSNRKNDLFAMLRQLGKPTVFLTMSANEINWPDLIKLLHRLNDYYKEIQVVDPIVDLDRSKRAHLVNEDPITCCIYFDKLKDTIFSMIQSKASFNPFGKYRVLDYFFRIEFQHRGSPHVHALLWLDNDPRETVSEFMPNTIQLINDLCAVKAGDLPEGLHQNQVHRHTFTCQKRGEASCRFGIPYWPMRETRILVPLAKDDGRRESLKTKSSTAKTNLERKVYISIDEFLEDNRLNEESYLNMIRSTLKKPTVFFKREMNDIMTNTFNPAIGTMLKSNMDLQFVLDEYSCAAYVVDYINKSNRGSGQLHRELVKLSETHPELTSEKLMKEIGKKILNSVEMSAQEASWYLLRKPMSQASREVIYIPTNWPVERNKAHKKWKQLKSLDPDSTDIWTKSLIEKYEERPESLDSLCLADYAAWYANAREHRAVSDDIEEPDEAGEEVEHSNSSAHPRKRNLARVIRYRNYDKSDTNNHKRELVTLFVPFRSELLDILDQNKFLNLYSEKFELITDKSHEYQSKCDIDTLLREARDLLAMQDDGNTLETAARRDRFSATVLGTGTYEDFSDLDNIDMLGSCMVRTRTNMMSKDDYCRAMRETNPRQRELILEFIHRLTSYSEQPIQVFFTGPAGCGKTYTLKLLMETLNRYNSGHTTNSNAFLACATTGKAAVNFNGTTVDSVFHFARRNAPGHLSPQLLQKYRQVFKGVKCIIIDEVSMLGSAKFHEMERKLREITGEHDLVFGGMHMIFCGDLRQLAPVAQACIYKGSRNHLEGAFLWQSMSYYPLSQIMRQADVKFSTLLTKIGDGQALDQDESDLIESRFRTEKWCDEQLPDVIRLFHSNQDCEAYNNRTMIGATEFVAEDTFSNYSTPAQLAAARKQVNQMKLADTGGCSYILRLLKGFPYMITSNIDVEDGLVNGAIGILKFAGCQSDDGNRMNMCLWLQFPKISTGAKARLKSLSTIISNRDIDRNWTPIKLKTVSIKTDNGAHCKRSQFPLQPTSAITIHKSQGGTFDKGVIYYHRGQATSLVYVALSRVVSIEGLFLIDRDRKNEQSGHRFHHRFGSEAPAVKDIRNEYRRLSCHPLITLTNQMNKFSQVLGDASLTLTIGTINAQSLVAHYRDIETDTILSGLDFLLITETWMCETSKVTIEGYSLENYTRCARDSGGSETHAGCSKRKAGGVAVYQRIETMQRLLSSCSAVESGEATSAVADITIVDIKFNASTSIFLAAIYVHPNSTPRDIKTFLESNLLDLRRGEKQGGDRILHDAPLVLSGDFNVDVNDSDWLVDYMKRIFDLEYVPCPGPTTLGNTTIDLTFVRGARASSTSFVSYFSYHRPLINKIYLDH